MALPAVIASGGSPNSGVTADQFNDLIKIQAQALKRLTSIESSLVKSASRLAEERLEGMSAAGAAAGAGGAAAAPGGGGGGLGGLLKGAGAAGLAGGLGIAAVLAGAGLAAGGVSLLLNTLAEPGLGKAIKDNVDELLSINEGNAKTLQSLDLLAVFTSLGMGLAVFGVGSTVIGLSSAVNKAFGVEGWAETIHDNVIKLLSIAEDAGGKGELLAGAGSVAASLAMLGVGLAWFGVGSTIAGLSDALINFANSGWATSIKDNVLILLSITESGASSLGNAALVLASLSLLGVGLAFFGIGSTIGGLGDALLNFANDAWATSIKDNVLVLLSIADEGAKMLGNAALVMGALSILGIGLAFFTAGSTIAGLGDALLNFANSSWAQNIKDNVFILLSIAEEGAAFIGKSALVFASLSLLGTALALFGIGSTIAGLGDALTNFANASWATNIKENVFILLSIAEEGASVLGSAAITMAALSLLGTGLAFFGVGSTISGLGDALTNFSSPEWATNIKNNVLTLLSIAKEGGSVIGDAAKVLASLSILGVGLAFFAVTSTISGLADALVNFSNAEWAQNIKDNVLILLSIAEEGASVIGDAALVLASLSLLGAGLAIFGAASTVTGLADALTNFVNPEWAQNIKDNVITLLSISDSDGEGKLETLAKTGTVFAALSGLAAGMALFAVGTGVVAFVDKITGNKDYAQQIKDQVTTLLSIAGDPNATPEKVKQVTDAMASISKSLGDFAGQTFFSALKGAGAAVFEFFGGDRSPTKSLLELAAQADELEQVGNALDHIGMGLSTFAAVGNLGSVDLKDFAEDLTNSLPAIEAAIMGGKIEGGWFKSDIIYKGLASDDIKFEEAARNIKMLTDAFTIEAPIIQSAVIQGPAAQAVTGGAVGGGETNTNVVTVMGSSSSSVSAVNQLQSSPGTSNPASPLSRRFNR